MAGPSRYTALLDSCVLYPALVRDALLSLHRSCLFAVKWTSEIEQEWTRNLLANRSDIDPAKLQRTCELMREGAPDWQVEGYEDLVEALTLPDAGDRHVVAAAIRGHADCIVTTNLQDFPPAYLERFDLEVFHPDDFIVLQLDLDPLRALKQLKAMRQRLRNPSMDPGEFAQAFANAGLVRTAARLAEAAELLG
jgi:hypothetical protein